MKRTGKKLKLDRETVRALTGAALTRVGGAFATEKFNCGETGYGDTGCGGCTATQATICGGGGGGSIATCFPNCETIVSQKH